MEDELSHLIRMNVFEWLHRHSDFNNGVFDWQLLANGYSFKNETIPLIGAKGIWKPKVFREFPLSITSVQKSNYADEFVDDDILKYSYRGTDPNHSDNVGLRECWKKQIPLIYFHQIIKGRYCAAWPVFVVGDEPAKLNFLVSVESIKVMDDLSTFSEPESVYRRKYETRKIFVRMHQASFRERVLNAYKESCAVCSLKHRQLLDAAHIIPDALGGNPEIPNGLSLCKIHHAAYDQNIIGISPDYIIEIRNDILEEVDGPMLKHGLQEFNKSKLQIPNSSNKKPNKDWLDVRYQQFRSA